MSELKNTFCWSFSQAQEFADCKRRHYWNRYGMWGGWDAGASEEARMAYRLKQMQNKWSLIGGAVEDAVLDVLERRRVKSEFSVEASLNLAMKKLRTAWTSHCSEVWRIKPKRCTCISEIYYDEISVNAGEDRERWGKQVKQRTEICLRNFYAHVLPRLPEVTYDDMVPFARPEQGDPEHFHIGNIKVYAIPDWVYRLGEKFIIHDWKTGVRREKHKDQLQLYGLWSQMKHSESPENIKLYVEYLESGEFSEIEYSSEIANLLCDKINSSVREMKKYLKDGDTEKNEPLEKDAFPKTDDYTRCKNCNYRELCNRKYVSEM